MGKTKTGVLPFFKFMVGPLLTWQVTRNLDQDLNLARETRKRQKKKKIHDDILSANFDAIVILWIYTQFGPMLKLDFGRMVCKTNVFININFLSYKNCKQNSNISNTVLILLLWVKVIFSPKNANFLQKKCWHQQKQVGPDTKG